MINNKELTYSIQKNIVSVYYKDMIDNPLTEAKTAEDLIDLVEQEDLPDVQEIKSIRTTLSKAGAKYRLIALLRYNSNGEPGSRSITFENTEEEVYNQQTENVTIPQYIVVSDDDGNVVLDYVNQ